MKDITTCKSHQELTPSIDSGDPEACLVDQAYLINNPVYAAKVTVVFQNNITEKKNDIGLCQCGFISWYANHQSSCWYIHKNKVTKLAKHVLDYVLPSVTRVGKISISSGFKCFHQIKVGFHSSLLWTKCQQSRYPLCTHFPILKVFHNFHQGIVTTKRKEHFLTNFYNLI